MALAAGGIAITAAAGPGGYLRSCRILREEYTVNALYMAVLDDEISRRELAALNELPTKKKTLRYKYQLYLELNRKRSRKEIFKLEYRLKSLNERTEALVDAEA